MTSLTLSLDSVLWLRSSAWISLVGRQVVGTINLGKKKLPGGFLSEFLVMGALNPDGTVRLLELPKDTPPGSPVM